MDLNTCPSCDAFIRSDWTNCRSCGAELALPVPVEAAPADAELIESPPVESASPDAPWSTSEFHVEEPAHVWDQTPDEPVDQYPHVEPIADVDPTDTPVVDAPAAADYSAPSPEADPVQTPSATYEDDFTNALKIPKPPVAAFDQPTPTYFDANPPQPATPPPPAQDGTYLPYAYDPNSRIPAHMTPPQVAQWAQIDTGSSFPLAAKIGLAAVGTLVAIIVLAIAAVSFLGTNTTATAKPKTVTTTTTAPPAANATKWSTYADPASRFTVDFPDPRTVSSVNGVDIVRGTLKEDSTGAVLYARNLAAGETANDDVLTKALKFAAPSDFSTKSPYMSTTNGHRQLDAHLETADQSRAIDARFFIVGRTVYGVMLVSETANGNPDAFSRIAESFKTAQ